MALFFKSKATRENRIENSGRWPIRLTNFFLVDDYEFPPSQYPEIFFVKEGTFLHETDTGNQALRRGAIVINHPSNRHTIKQPEEVLLVRIRFLPEWLAKDYSTVIDSPDVLSLFFDQSWFHYPTDSTLHVMSMRDEQVEYVENEIALLQEVLRAGRHLEPIARIGLLKLMLILGDEYHYYWRGDNRMELRPEVRTALDFIERNVTSGENLKLKDLEPATDMTQDHLGRVFRKATGVTLVDYAQRRRIHHAAYRLLTTTETAKDISEQLGFTDSAHFSKSFQKYFNLSPNVYRQKYGSTAESD
ncbi:MAG: helix-turn-helix transcriptional regulator [Verrucomicrobiales bacterium]|nr:helix-turn-helix transcriptional regulator [Verrucomicrobiales bacterium]